MIYNRSDLKSYILFEKQRYGVKGKFIYNLKNNENVVLFKLQKRLRLTEFYYNTNKKLRLLFSMRKLNRIQNKYSIHIPLNSCEKGLKIMHIGPVLISNGAKIGENCSIHSGVSIVAGGTNDYSPILGNNIVVGVGAVLLGNIRIEDGTAVGANAVVNKSFDEKNITIAGIPAKKISQNGSKGWNKGGKNNE